MWHAEVPVGTLHGPWPGDGEFRGRPSGQFPAHRQVTGSNPVPPTGDNLESSPPACGNVGKEGGGMTQAPSVIFKIPTKSPQPGRGKTVHPAARAKTGRPATGRVFANGTGRAVTRGGSEVIELEFGITVYPAREEKPLASRLVRGRQASAVRGVQQGEAGRQAGEGDRAAGGRRAQHEAARRTSSSTTWTPTGTPLTSGGPASTRTPSAVCASGLPPRSLTTDVRGRRHHLDRDPGYSMPTLGRRRLCLPPGTGSADRPVPGFRQVP
jgi:hypothetical protein